MTEKQENESKLEIVPNQQRRLLATLFLKNPGINWYSLEVSYHPNFSNEPCVMDSRCRLVDQDKNNVKTLKSTLTATQCLSIRTSFGRIICLAKIEIEKNKPLGMLETKERLLESAFVYTEDAKDSPVRNLYGTVLQYKCPFGQHFSIGNNEKKLGVGYDAKQGKEKETTLVASYNISCLWNQTWENLYSNGTSLPNCVGKKRIYNVYIYIYIYYFIVSINSYTKFILIDIIP